MWSRPLGVQWILAGLREYGTNRKDEAFLEMYRFFCRSKRYGEEMERLSDAAFFTYTDKGIGRTAARALYSPILNGSVTRMEQYAACAYAHFLAYGLELSERPVYELAAADIGNLFHGAIDGYFKRMKEEKRSFSSMSEEDRKRLVRECVAEVTEEYGNTIMKSSARNRYLEKKVLRITDRTVWALTEQLKRGDFEPTGFEVSFSVTDNLRAMRIPLSGDEAIHLRGRIDRIDLCEDGDRLYLKIVDYKTGKTKFNLTDIYHGLQLQLVVYMDAALKIQKQRNPKKEAVPAGIFYYHIDDPVLERQEGMSEEDVEAGILKKLRMNGLVNSSLEVIRHLDKEIEKESDVIPVAMKDGYVQEAKSSVAGGERFSCLSGFVEEKLKTMGEEILEGNTAVSPYKQGNRTACDYCPYHSICGFDLKTSGFAYRKLKSMKAEEIWKQMEEAEPEKEENDGPERKEAR